MKASNPAMLVTRNSVSRSRKTHRVRSRLTRIWLIRSSTGTLSAARLCGPTTPSASRAWTELKPRHGMLDFVVVESRIACRPGCQIARALQSAAKSGHTIVGHPRLEYRPAGNPRPASLLLDRPIRGPERRRDPCRSSGAAELVRTAAPETARRSVHRAGRPGHDSRCCGSGSSWGPSFSGLTLPKRRW